MMAARTPALSLDAACTAFEGTSCIASGPLERVALKVKTVLDRRATSSVLIFDDTTSEVIDVDYRGTGKDVLHRLAERADAGRASAPSPETDLATPRGPGRPRLGVVAREITLLPRHWQWLNGQPGGASVALRRLVDAARHTNVGRDRVRRSQEVAYRFMTALAGNQPGFEEAIRALFAADRDRFDEQIAAWPVDVRNHARKLAAGAFA
jgi:hypothetical protein